MYDVNWCIFLGWCVCECRLKIKDLCSIVFYVWLVKWSFFVTSVGWYTCVCCAIASLTLCVSPFCFRRDPFCQCRYLLARFFDVMLLIVTYCLPCSLISFISIFVGCHRARKTHCIAISYSAQILVDYRKKKKNKIASRSCWEYFKKIQFKPSRSDIVFIELCACFLTGGAFEVLN